MDVVGVGALNYDRLFKVERIAASGNEVEVLSMKVAPGGSAANTIVGLARLGLKTGFIGKVGLDEEGEFILHDLRREGVDLGGVAMEKGKTGQIFAFVDERGERAMYAYPGVNDYVRIDESKLVYAGKAKYLHLSSFVGETSYQAQRELIKKLRGVNISFAPGMLYARRNVREVNEMIASTAVLFMNEDETKVFTAKDYKVAADELLETGAQIVAVTLGDRGCYIASPDERIHVNAYPVEVVDTTGAGDAFAAGFLYGLLNNESLMKCGSIGNWVASRCIAAMGAREGLPNVKELRQKFS
jgi:ribokinase